MNNNCDYEEAMRNTYRGQCKVFSDAVERLWNEIIKHLRVQEVVCWLSRVLG